MCRKAAHLENTHKKAAKIGEISAECADRSCFCMILRIFESAKTLLKSAGLCSSVQELVMRPGQKACETSSCTLCKAMCKIGSEHSSCPPNKSYVRAARCAEF